MTALQLEVNSLTHDDMLSAKGRSSTLQRDATFITTKAALLATTAASITIAPTTSEITMEITTC
jgi:hypothetical protein